MHQQSLPDWKGRDDTTAEGSLAIRWHQQVKPWESDAPPGYTFLGFACDEGVRRNSGRVGAAQAPSVIRQALSNLAWHQSLPLYDAGDVKCSDSKLDAAQTEHASRVASLLQSGQRPIILGGGHETAWGTFQGIAAHSPKKSLGIINLDAHFDLRQSTAAHSGTPFAQMAQWCHQHQQSFHYFCLGIAEASNTQALFHQAKILNASWLTDEELAPSRYQQLISKIENFINQVDQLYLSIDLDVLPVSVMSAVSAPAGYGVSLEVVCHLIQMIAGTGKLLAADVVEYNPLLDIQRTDVRVVARLIWHLTRHWQPLTGSRA